MGTDSTQVTGVAACSVGFSEETASLVAPANSPAHRKGCALRFVHLLEQMARNLSILPIFAIGLWVCPQKAAATSSIQLWSRGAGQYSDGLTPKRVREGTFLRPKNRLSRQKRFDVQYGRSETYRAVTLQSILDDFHPAAHDDMVLLHFENGMQIPVPLEPSALAKLNLFLAFDICDKTGSCDSHFPEVAKDDAYSVTPDPRPITFSWNKIVTATPWHPDIPEARASLFSPWHHANTLTGIEFVNAQAFRAQFALGEPSGERVFQERCQFCHAIHQVGATYGWDFVTPLPIFEQRKPESLLNHVKYPKVQATKMGLMMPNQKDVTLEEMQVLWRWMKRAAKHPVQPYKP